MVKCTKKPRGFNLINKLLKKYNQFDLTIEELIHTMDKRNFNETEIKNDGIIYTPMYISDYIVKTLKPKLDETVFEPSFGHGIFIFSLLNYMEKKYSLTADELKQYFLKKVYGQDIQEGNLKEFLEIVNAYFLQKGIKKEIKSLPNFTISDTLKTTNFFDIILGNPPYIRTKNIEQNYLSFLRKEFKSCEKGNIDIYYAFIEFAYKFSKRSSFITPNSWLYNTSAENLRSLVKEDLFSVIDFQQKQIFETAATYTSIFLINKNENNDNILFKNTLESKILKIEKKELNNQRWSFYIKKKLNLNFSIQKYHTPIATLRDRIFITNEVKSNQDFIPFYKISKVKSIEEFENTQKQILFPYKWDDNSYVIKEEAELNKDTLNYLNKHKEELNKRDKGKTEKYPSWYAYGRKQGFNRYDKNNHIIIIQGMMKKGQKYFSIPLKNIDQPFLFSSGFLLEVDNFNVKKVINFLNSSDFQEILINEGKVWKGKDEESSYYSLSITQLKKILKR